MLAIARSLSRRREAARRSALFVWHVGEEKGLLGSRGLWTIHGADRLSSRSWNADMIGRNAATLLYVSGRRPRRSNRASGWARSSTVCTVRSQRRS